MLTGMSDQLVSKCWNSGLLFSFQCRFLLSVTLSFYYSAKYVQIIYSRIIKRLLSHDDASTRNMFSRGSVWVNGQRILSVKVMLTEFKKKWIYLDSNRRKKSHGLKHNATEGLYCRILA